MPTEEATWPWLLYSPGPRHHVLHLHLYCLNWLWQWTQAWLKNTLLLVNTDWETHVLNMVNQASPLAIRMGSHVQLTLYLQSVTVGASHLERCCRLKQCIEFLVGDKGWWSTKKETSYSQAVKSGIFWGVKNQLPSKRSIFEPEVFYGPGYHCSLSFKLPKRDKVHQVITPPRLCWVH